ncbi:hypothetical protein PHSY_004977 [Pseudozyma hubeiensis SY62]|uniref:Uncharacterized protein n=1 Tax=Pseudozyma hubeiensis (strain SY62) TaxID=1305764 RepID=R9P830_PSEHS|nr:hypothetical protein PHSY_004977 [Pseudozyma hubeiensis SY62]GAC97392.1 hypothetical protein PHSY_004977 [Pseudozyma hubeiensis SY62]
MNERYNDRSSSPARKLWPFNRSRSSSPNTQGQPPNLSLDTSFQNTNRSRVSSHNSANNAISPSGSASSFVVRSVIRAPGGVSLPSSPAHEQSRNSFSNDSRHQSASPASRRMTLEDSDDEHERHEQQHLQYRRSKSKPLGAPASLGVPPGGPGGGVGYGTARSSNDGRPESAAAHQPSPFYRPASPSGSITAGDFQRGAERGRVPRKSNSGYSSSTNHSGHPSDQHRPGSAQSGPSPTAKKPVARITAGPKSLTQQQQEDLDQHHRQAHFQQQNRMQQHPASRGASPAAAAARNNGMAGPRGYPGGPPSPSGHQPHPQHHQQHPHAPRDHRAGPPSMDQRGDMSLPLLPPQHTPGHEGRDESPSRSRRFSFGLGGRSRKDSEKGAAPLDGLPSPVDIPFGRSSHSPLRFGDSAETDYSRANSPFGSVSPARAGASPNSSGFLSNLMRKQAADESDMRQPRNRDDVPRSCSPGGGSNMAGKWFKGVFGRSPRADEKEPNYASDLSPFPLTVSRERDAEDEAAYAQKLASMRQARHIVDEERQRYMMGPTTPTGARGAPGSAQRFDPQQDREFRPRQVVDSDVEGSGMGESDADVNAALEFELERKKSPPGRKPVPAYLPSASPSRDVTPPQDEPLTPAQRIIQETRSKQLAREQIEAQRKDAIVHQKQVSGGDPRQMVAAHAQINGPPTPPKGKAGDAGHQQRFPSGAHQITREPARGVAQAQPQTQTHATTNNADPAAQRNAATLAPGVGPMPADLSLPDALQEMMVRFYRFERYSVPLIRSLETRLLDIERDAMLANNPQARNGTRASIASNNSAEMDRWVNQMTGLMKHEVGQLKAATRELKESRELVATVARYAGAASGGMGLSMSVSSFGSLVAITPSASAQPVQQKEVVQEGETKTSSSAGDSAVPRNLNLPAGAKPALGKDERKHGSPTKANFGFASESGKEMGNVRDRSVSPNGRPRFTSVLGQPLGKEQGAEGEGGFKRENSVENRLKALVEAKDDAKKLSHSQGSAAEGRRVVEEAEATADESGSSDIAAALAAIDASSFAAAAASESAESHQEDGQSQHHVAISKSSSHSSSNSGSGSVEEPLTPTVEAPPITTVEPAAALLDRRNQSDQAAFQFEPDGIACDDDDDGSNFAEQAVLAQIRFSHGRRFEWLHYLDGDSDGDGKSDCERKAGLGREEEVHTACSRSSIVRYGSCHDGSGETRR